MRSKKAIINSIAGIGYEIVAIVCGLILPRLMLSFFGSKYNGITSSITQFLSCIALMKAGIGGVSRAALYKALANKDDTKVSEIVKATQLFMNKVALAFLGFVVVFSFLYSMLLSDEFEPLFSASLILVISISTFGEYYFGFTYEVLLSANQKQYVFSVIRIITTIVNTFVATVLIYSGLGIRAVKLGSSLVFLLNPIIIRIYARRKYNIDDNVEPDKDLLAQRWDAVGHEVANFVNTNTDIMVLTIFSDVLFVSVYTVYNTVIVGIKKVIKTFINGFGAAFGEMYARNEIQLMEENFRIYELIVFSMVSVVFSITAVMFVPYAKLYTSGVTDVEYAQPLFALIITLAGAFGCIRTPYQDIVTVAGHFKQTRNGSFVEAMINICISIVTVIKFGLVGVAIGTLVANLFRTVQYAIYMSKNVLVRRLSLFVKHTVIFTVILLLTNLLMYRIVDLNCGTVIEWIINAAATGFISLTLTIMTDCIFYKQDTLKLIDKIKYVLLIKNTNKKMR